MNDVIFRAYDIRGTYLENLFESDAYLIGKGLGSCAIENGKTNVLVGYDNRLSSPLLAEKLIEGILSTGANVVNLGLVTTPMYYFARYKLNIWTAAMITASHNPANDNGFKVSFNEIGNACGEEIAQFRDFIKKGSFKSGNGVLKSYCIKDEYINLLTNNLKIDSSLKVAFDCGNGTCGIILKDIVSKLNIEPFYLYCDSDGTFPNHHPDPAVAENLVDLQKFVVDNKCDIGISFDADGDRVRVIDHEGTVINSDIYMLVVYRYLNNNLKVRKGLIDVKCSKSLIDGLNELDIEVIMNRTGNSYQFRKMRELKLDFGGEYSGHIWFGDRFDTFDCGIYAGLRMVEILSNTKKTLKELTSDIKEYFSTDEIKIKSTETGKVQIVEKVKEYCLSKNYSFNDIDGVRVMFDDGWALVRYSNTSPNVTVRFEANNKKRLEEIQNEFLKVVEDVK